MKTTRDFVATAFVIHADKVLLVFHKKLKKWLPPGGHIHENELPDEAAIREVKEETGLDIELLGEKQPQKIDSTIPLTQPEFIQLEDIEKGKELHQHIDLMYLAKPRTYEIKSNKESEEIRWFSIEELDKEDMPADIRYHAKRMIEKMKTLNNLSY